MAAEQPESTDQGPDLTDVSKNRQLFASIYRDLRALAERQLRHGAGAPISPTTLLHETYLGMSNRSAAFPDRGRFIGYAARVMRGLIIDLARERRALKRGGAFHITRLSVDDEAIRQQEISLARLADALDELATREPRLAEVVDLKYFCGFTFEEIAAQRDTSERTVKRDWEKARPILFEALSEAS
jgi:RNA polymerase sigma factor (TIGR02999 family)